jgi:hypothetical protein
MKNKGLIIGGVAIVALGAYWWMKKKNSTTSQDTSMEDSGSTTTTNGKGTSPKGTNGNTGETGVRTDNNYSSTTNPVVNVVPMQLTLKPINNAVDLQGTKLGTDIGLTNASSVVLGNVTNAIARLNSVGREVLNYISDTNSLQRATPEFAKGLDAKVGQGASSLNFAERLVTFLRRNKTGVAAFPSAPAPSTSFSGSYSFSQPIGESAFYKTGFEIDKEDYEFNGDHIL